MAEKVRTVVPRGSKRKPEAAANFTANDMRVQWVQWWAPDQGAHADRATAWREFADQAGVEERWEPPSFADFALALRDTHGAAGFDG